MRCKKLLLGCAGLLASVAFLCIGCGDKGGNVPIDEGPYELVATAMGGGSVSKNPDKPLYEAGEQVTVMAIADDCYAFDRWSGFDGIVSTSDTVAQFSMNKNMTVVAHFVRQLAKLQVDVNSIYWGTVAEYDEYDNHYYNSELLPTGGELKIPIGTSKSVVAIPNPGYEFIRWSGALNSTTRRVNVIVDDDMTITANFQRDATKYIISLAINPPGAGRVSDPGDVYGEDTIYSSATSILAGNYNGNKQLYIAENPGWTFVEWSGDVEFIRLGTNKYSDMIIFNNIDGDGVTHDFISLVANFRKE